MVYGSSQCLHGTIQKSILLRFSTYNFKPPFQPNYGYRVRVFITILRFPTHRKTPLEVRRKHLQKTSPPYEITITTPPKIPIPSISQWHINKVAQIPLIGIRRLHSRTKWSSEAIGLKEMANRSIRMPFLCIGALNRDSMGVCMTQITTAFLTAKIC